MLNITNMHIKCASLNLHIT